MSAVPKPRRRWFVFSLRTLFALLTAVGVALGWLEIQRRTVQQRQQMMEVILKRNGMIASSDDPIIGLRSITMNPETFDVGMVREYFGDQFIFSISLTESMSREHEARVRSLFPEAKIDTVSDAWLDFNHRPRP